MSACFTQKTCLLGLDCSLDSRTGLIDAVSRSCCHELRLIFSGLEKDKETYDGTTLYIICTHLYRRGNLPFSLCSVLARQMYLQVYNCFGTKHWA